MAYVINRYDGSLLATVEDGTLDTSTSIGLLGRNYTGYGEVQNENFLHILENFSNDIPPLRPISGQLWYNNTTKTLKLYDGTNWKAASSADIAANAGDVVEAEGALWFKSDTKQLFIYQAGQWRLVGPEAVAGFGDTKFESVILKDTSRLDHPVILVKVDGIIHAIVAKNYFTIAEETPVLGFSSLVPGINVSDSHFFKGNLVGNSDTTTSLRTPRKINNVNFDGQQDITITSNTTNELVAGTYISGNNFNGSVARTWSVNATPNNVIGTVVARDSSGNFSAGTITSNIVGNVVGNVTISTGTSKFNKVEANEFIGATLSGNAYSASRLQVARKINGVSFDGTSDITVTADAFTLTNTRLNPTVVESSLTTVGTLNSLEVAAPGIEVDNILGLFVDSNTNTPYISSSNSQGLVFRVADSSLAGGTASLVYMSGTQALSLGADEKSMIAPKTPNGVNLGSNNYKFNKTYTNYLYSPVLNTQTLNSTAGDNSLTVSSNLIIEGNLVVNGNTTTINSVNVSVDDLTFTLAAGTLTPELANGAGLIVDGSFASILYSSTGDKWTINKPLDAGNYDITTTGEFRGTATSARYADLAENYQADAQYEPGTVLEFGGEFEVTVAEDSTRRIAGVVSTNPAYLMNSELVGNNVVSVALQGRVPCKVRGNIKKGDMLISSGSGFARPSSDPALGSVIGKALEDFVGIEGIIEIVVGRI